MQEQRPALDARSPDWFGVAVDTQPRLPGIAKEAFIDRSPPWASRPIGTGRGENAPTDLPPHKGRLRSTVWPNVGDSSVVEAGSKLQPSARVVSDGGHHGCGLILRARSHPRIITPRSGPSSARTPRLEGGYVTGNEIAAIAPRGIG